MSCRIRMQPQSKRLTYPKLTLNDKFFYKSDAEK